VIALILGGASSGKSAVAERLVATLPEPVTYLATWIPDPSDADMVARVEAHRARRPPHWTTRAAGTDLAGALSDTAGTVLLDALGPWVAGAPEFAVDTGRLCEVLVSRLGDTVIVSDEVGLGVHPSTGAGRLFRDVLGAVNQAVAAVADPVWLVVAGRILPLSAPEIDAGGPNV
jgi:adenosyl cobinamide kinase/adenosyl cobinamide phosphate guanylyltransferase